ncbi:MAG: aldolase [Hyphomicrobium sp.]
MDGAAELVHATAIALRIGAEWRAALIRGPSGAGKSDLALRCIASARGPLAPGEVVLIADDQVQIVRRRDRLEASCPPAIRGKLEVRGIGMIDMTTVEAAEVALIVDLVARGGVPRLPDPPPRNAILGITLPVLALHAFDISAALKLLIALHDHGGLGGVPTARLTGDPA